MPVERLAREKRAGGRRRANREDRSRGRHGPRPEEVRAERRQEGQPSRRQEEAQGRERASKRGAAAPTTTVGETRADATSRGAAFAESFRASTERIRPAGAPELGGGFAPTSSTPGAEADQAPFAALESQRNPAAPEALVDRSGRGSAPRAVIAAGTGSARPGPIQPGAVATPDGATGKTSTTEGLEKSEASRPEASHRWAETAEAERAAAVLRQFRLQLHPALRAATLSLSPAELGRISIRLDVKDARVRAAVRAESAETLKILEYHLPELEASLAQQGLEVDEFELELGFGEQGAGASEGGEGAAPHTDAAPPLDAPIDQTLLARALAQQVGVDMYA